MICLENEHKESKSGIPVICFLMYFYCMEQPQIDHWRNLFINWLNTNWAQDDKAHDLHHLHRVWRNCKKIANEEHDHADMLVLLTAAYFHDLVSLPKSDPDRNKSSWFSAEKTVGLLSNKFSNFPAELLPAVHHAIHAHSFSANVQTTSLEAAILQDADRMEALGAMGIARLFYTAGLMGSNLYNADDPAAKHRILNDSSFALDHIDVKLLKLPATMKTVSGRRMAETEAAYILDFKTKMLKEITED